MSSRQEEKARRKAEREEQERKAAAAATNSRRLQIVGGVVLGLAAIAAVVVVLASGGGGDDDKGTGKASASSGAKVSLPAVKIKDLDAAAKAAGCVLLNPPSEGQDHVEGEVTYKNSNPPASGPHNQIPADDGIYAVGNEPTKEHWVHSLEHGRIEIQYAPGTPAKTIDQLEAVSDEPVNGSEGYHRLVFQNNTDMKYKVAAVAWTHILGCEAMNDKVFDAIRAFRTTYTDKGPELIP